MSELEIRPLHADEIQRFAEISYYAFAGRMPDERASDFGRRVVPERNVLVAIEDGAIVSQVLMYDLGVWIDGVRFPSAGLANVATVPERARRGYARHLLKRALAWMHETMGVALATLYPTVHPLYSGLGWALAEEGLRYAGPSDAFRPSPSLPIDRGGRIVRRPASINDADLLEPIYRSFAMPRSGYLDRPRWYWEDMVLRVRGTQPRWLGLWYSSDGQLSGYVLYTLNGPVLSPRSESELRVYELVSNRAEGFRDLLGFLSAHHLWQRVDLKAGRDVPWPALVANPHQLEVSAPLRQHFMLRLIDVQKAICLKRAVSAGPCEDLALRVRDDACPWNDGTWLIGLRNGRWTCEAAPDREPAATVDIATLSTLFTGFLTTRQAVDVGTLRATDAALSTLSLLFSTIYPPHSPDSF